MTKAVFKLRCKRSLISQESADVDVWSHLGGSGWSVDADHVRCPWISYARKGYADRRKEGVQWSVGRQLLTTVSGLRSVADSADAS